MELEFVKPEDIERRSFEIIRSEIGEISAPEENLPVILRVIHTTADLEYCEDLCFSENAVKKALAAIKKGAVIVTDTNMALSGINRSALKKLGCKAMCFMSDDDVAERAQHNGTTRAYAAVDKAAALSAPVIHASGNAPTALIGLYEHIKKKSFIPELIIGVPVGFVNVVQSKELIMESGVPYIVSKGRKGGSTVAAAICNALLYMAGGRNYSESKK